MIILRATNSKPISSAPSNPCLWLVASLFWHGDIHHHHKRCTASDAFRARSIDRSLFDWKLNTTIVPLVWSRITPWHVGIFYIILLYIYSECTIRMHPSHKTMPPRRIVGLSLCLGRIDQITRCVVRVPITQSTNPLYGIYVFAGGGYINAAAVVVVVSSMATFIII